jgi:hypothetical protein
VNRTSNKLTRQIKKPRGFQTTAAASFYEFYLWQAVKLAGNGRRFLAPGLSQGLHHRVIAILLLLKLNMERTLNQLPLMLQQPLTADDNPPS